MLCLCFAAKKTQLPACLVILHAQTCPSSHSILGMCYPVQPPEAHSCFHGCSCWVPQRTELSIWWQSVMSRTGSHVQRRHVLTERVLCSGLSTELGSKNCPHLHPLAFIRPSWGQNEGRRPRRDSTRNKTGPSMWSHEVKLVCVKNSESQIISWFKSPTLRETQCFDKGWITPGNFKAIKELVLGDICVQCFEWVCSAFPSHRATVN